MQRCMRGVVVGQTDNKKSKDFNIYSIESRGGR